MVGFCWGPLSGSDGAAVQSDWFYTGKGVVALEWKKKTLCGATLTAGEKKLEQGL